MFRGVYTALITPFRDGKLDEAAFERLVEHQINGKVQGIVPCGTTGESPTLTHEEHERLIELAVKLAGGRTKIMAGTGSNNTAEAIRFTRHAEGCGADAVLVVAPYYNKPTEEGLYRHYKAIHDATNLPIVLYNIPGRSVINMSDGLIARLADLPRIAGVKDATGDLARVSTLRMKAGHSFCQLSGEDITALAFNAQGGQGVISVTSNIAPAEVVAVQNAWFAGDAVQALALHDKLVPLHDAMFCETSPAPVKYAASRLGIGTDEVRLPLVPASESARRRVDEALAKAGIA